MILLQLMQDVLENVIGPSLADLFDKVAHHVLFAELPRG